MGNESADAACVTVMARPAEKAERQNAQQPRPDVAGEIVRILVEVVA
jgi:hypothetical protein